MDGSWDSEIGHFHALERLRRAGFHRPLYMFFESSTRNLNYATYRDGLNLISGYVLMASFLFSTTLAWLLSNLSPAAFYNRSRRKKKMWKRIDERGKTTTTAEAVKSPYRFQVFSSLAVQIESPQ